MRTNVLIVLDTETCNLIPSEKVTPNNNLVYNIGWQAIVPTTGKILHKKSYIVREIFFGEWRRMKTCYYKDKLPQYYAGISDGSYQIESFFTIMNEISDYCKNHNVVAICAHNARFDVDALNTTARYLTGYNNIRALPNVEIWDSMKMAQSIFLPKKSYVDFCKTHGYMTKHATPRPRLTAEVLYRFITNNMDFEEEHTALADVQIECVIIHSCYKAHKKMNKVLYPSK